MGLRYLTGKLDSGTGPDGVVFYCSTSGWAFGPLMDSIEEAEAFEAHLRRRYPRKDPRALSTAQLEEEWGIFVESRGEE